MPLEAPVTKAVGFDPGLRASITVSSKRGLFSMVRSRANRLQAASGPRPREAHRSICGNPGLGALSADKHRNPCRFLVYGERLKATFPTELGLDHQADLT